MYIEDLTQTYRAKLDDELLELLAESKNLTLEARAVLFSEAAKRGLKAPELIQPSETISKGVIKAEVLSAGPFIAEVLKTFHARFWVFVRLVAPAVVIGYVTVHWSGKEIREIVSHMRYPAEPSLAELVRMSCFRFGGFVVSWVAFSFSYGAVCAEITLRHAGVVPSFGQCFTIVLRRARPFLRVVAVLFVGLLLFTALAMSLSTGLYWLSASRYLSLGRTALWWCSMGLTGIAWIVLSRFSLSVPAVVIGNERVGQAIFRSDEMTEGKWLILSALVVKSVWGGYIAGMIPYWLASRIAWTVPPPWWFGWVLTGLSIAAVAAIEPYMFVGFALLYLHSAPATVSAQESVAAV